MPKVSTRGDDFLSPFTPSPVRTNSSFFPSSTSILPNNTKLNPNPPAPGPAPAVHSPSVGDVHKEKILRRMSSFEAMNLALLLSEQETLHGVNMYDSLAPSDEPTIQAFVASGMPLEHAILTIFTNKYGKSNQSSSNLSSSNSGTASTYPSTLSINPNSDPRIGYTQQQVCISNFKLVWNYVLKVQYLFPGISKCKSRLSIL